MNAECIIKMEPLLRFVVECLAFVYLFIGTIDYLRWWNGMDENGDPK